MMHKPPKLLILYNADSTFLSAVWDWIVKALAPARYQCSLCALTHGLFTMRAPWKEFLSWLPLELVELHRDEFAEAYPNKTVAFPAIMLEQADGSFDPIVSREELLELEDLSGLIGLVQARLRTTI